MAGQKRGSAKSRRLRGKAKRGSSFFKLAVFVALLSGWYIIFGHQMEELWRYISGSTYEAKGPPKDTSLRRARLDDVCSAAEEFGFKDKNISISYAGVKTCKSNEVLVGSGSFTGLYQVRRNIDRSKTISLRISYYTPGHDDDSYKWMNKVISTVVESVFGITVPKEISVGIVAGATKRWDVGDFRYQTFAGEKEFNIVVGDVHLNDSDFIDLPVHENTSTTGISGMELDIPQDELAIINHKDAIERIKEKRREIENIRRLQEEKIRADNQIRQQQNAKAAREIEKQDPMHIVLKGGAGTADLHLGCKGGRTSVWLEFKSLRPKKLFEIKMRFDNKRPEKRYWKGSDRTARMIYKQPYQFIRSDLLKNNNFEMVFRGIMNREMRESFKLTGLRDLVGEMRKACKW